MKVLRSAALGLALSLTLTCLLGAFTPLAAEELSTPSSGFQWPLDPHPLVLRPFDLPTQRWNPGHRGVDLAAGEGQEVLAAESGTIVFAGQLVDREVISIQHPSGIRTTYEPVHPQVTVGALVTRGTVIGTVMSGHPGCPQAICMHWGARRGSGSTAKYFDPTLLIQGKRIRLKPLGDTTALYTTFYTTTSPS